MGSSIGLACREAGWDVQLADKDAESTAKAASVTGIPASEPGFVPDVIVVAAPPSQVVQVISDAIRMHPQSTVIDIASIKTEVLVQVEATCGQIAQYVPTHPMAGKETSGAASAQFDLLLDRRWVICPNAYTGPEHLYRVRQLIAACGAVVVEMDSASHDRAVALTSHVPQILSTALSASLEQLSDAEVAVSGQGLRDMTRLAGSSAPLWSQILSANATHVSAALASVLSELTLLYNSLSINVDDDITMIFERGNAQKARIPGRHGAAENPFSVVEVLIDDRPGQLAGIFASADRAGINIEDVRINHALGRAVAVVELSVESDVAKRLTQSLVSDGWKIRGGFSAE